LAEAAHAMQHAHHRQLDPEAPVGEIEWNGMEIKRLFTASIAELFRLESTADDQILHVL